MLGVAAAKAAVAHAIVNAVSARCCCNSHLHAFCGLFFIGNSQPRWNGFLKASEVFFYTCNTCEHVRFVWPFWGGVVCSQENSDPLALGTDRVLDLVGASGGDGPGGASAGRRSGGNAIDGVSGGVSGSGESADERALAAAARGAFRVTFRKQATLATEALALQMAAAAAAASASRPH